MSRRSTLVKDTIWEVNGLGWGILWIRGKTRSLKRERRMFLFFFLFFLFFKGDNVGNEYIDISWLILGIA